MSIKFEIMAHAADNSFEARGDDAAFRAAFMALSGSLSVTHPEIAQDMDAITQRIYRMHNEKIDAA